MPISLVTRVRLNFNKLLMPLIQAMSQALARSVLKEKRSTLSGNADYGSLIAASFGQEWNSFGEIACAAHVSNMATVISAHFTRYQHSMAKCVE